MTQDEEMMRYFRLRQDMFLLARCILAIDGFVCSDAITPVDKDALRFMANTLMLQVPEA